MFCFSFSFLANFAVVDVLPEPCKPAIKITAGGWVAKFKSSDSPNVSTKQSCTTLITCSDGLTAFKTDSCIASCFTFSKNSLITGKATSACNKAILISLKQLLISVSVSKPFADSLSNTELNLPESCSNICDSLSLSFIYKNINILK